MQLMAAACGVARWGHTVRSALHRSAARHDGGPMRRGADSVRALADSAVGAGKGAATKMCVPIGISDKQDNTKTVSSSPRPPPPPAAHSADQAPAAAGEAAPGQALAAARQRQAFIERDEKAASDSRRKAAAKSAAEAGSSTHPPKKPAGKEPERNQRVRSQPPKKPAGKEPECKLATLIRSVAEAERVVEYLSQKELERNIFAVDTETDGVDPTAQSPVGNGRVVCFSIYCGPTVNFEEYGETLDLSDVSAQVAAAAKEAVARKEEAAELKVSSAANKEAQAANKEAEAANKPTAAVHTPAALHGDAASLAVQEATGTPAAKRMRKTAAGKKDKEASVGSGDFALEASAPGSSPTKPAPAPAQASAEMDAPDAAAAAIAAADVGGASASVTKAMSKRTEDTTSVPETSECASTEGTECVSAQETPETTLQHHTPLSTQHTNQLSARGATAISNSISGKSKRLWVDTAGPEGQEVMQVFKTWLENPKFKKVFHNWSFDSHMFANHDVFVKGFAGTPLPLSSFAVMVERGLAESCAVFCFSEVFACAAWCRVCTCVFRVLIALCVLCTVRCALRSCCLPPSYTLNTPQQNLRRWGNLA